MKVNHIDPNFIIELLVAIIKLIDTLIKDWISK
jgi:hypothetical protein